MGCDPATTTPSFDEWADHIHPDDRSRVLRTLDGILTGGATIYRDEYRYLRADGRIGVMQDCAYVERAPDGRATRMLGALRDITDERTAERALRESEERFRQIAETIREVFWLTELETGRVLYVSPAFEALWGRSISSLNREPFAFLEAIHPEDRPRLLERLSGLNPGPRL